MALVQLTYERTHYETILVVVEVPDGQDGDDLQGLISEHELESCSDFESDDLRPGQFTFEDKDEISKDDGSPHYRLVNGKLEKA